MSFAAFARVGGSSRAPAVGRGRALWCGRAQEGALGRTALAGNLHRHEKSMPHTHHSSLITHHPSLVLAQAEPGAELVGAAARREAITERAAVLVGRRALASAPADGLGALRQRDVEVQDQVTRAQTA